MNSPIALVLVRLIAIFLLSQSLVPLQDFIYLLLTPNFTASLAEYFAIFSSVMFLFIPGLLLWVFSNYISIYVTGGAVIKDFGIDAVVLCRLTIFILGLFFVASSVNVVFKIVTAVAMNYENMNIDTIMPEVVSISVNIILGVMFLYISRGKGKLVEKIISLN